MTRHDRLSALLDLVMERGSVHIDDIIVELGVSPATARRDLDALAEQQLLTRTRGGASSNPTSSDLPLRYKASRQTKEKHRIAQAAAALVQPSDVVGLNGGTTTTEVGREIATLPALQGTDSTEVVVVTNAVNIANELTVRQHVRVVMTGGVARSRSYELTGPLAQRILDDITIDLLFLGVNAVEADGGAAAHDEGEAAINAALVSRSKRVVVVCDGTKIGQTAFARICPTTAITMIITDDTADVSAVQQLRDAGVDVRLV